MRSSAHSRARKQRYVADPRPDALTVGHELIEQRLPVERRFLDDVVARVDVLAHLLRQRVAVAEQVADANAAAADLVLVRRPDAARRRPDLPLAAPRLGQDVELAVIRKDDVGLLADQQPAVDVHAHPRQLVHLLEQRLRIDDDAVADDAGDAGMQDSGRDEMQDELRLYGLSTGLSWGHTNDQMAVNVRARMFARAVGLRGATGRTGAHVT